MANGGIIGPVNDPTSIYNIECNIIYIVRNLLPEEQIKSSVDYLVVAGGGGGGFSRGGGGGAGGYITSFPGGTQIRSTIKSSFSYNRWRWSR
jgi:hypothetical protein